MEESAKDSAQNVVIVYAVLFIIMIVAVFIGNELTTMFDSWNYCLSHTNTVNCTYDK